MACDSAYVILDDPPDEPHPDDDNEELRAWFETHFPGRSTRPFERNDWPPDLPPNVARVALPFEGRSCTCGVGPWTSRYDTQLAGGYCRNCGGADLGRPFIRELSPYRRMNSRRVEDVFPTSEQIATRLGDAYLAHEPTHGTRTLRQIRELAILRAAAHELPCHDEPRDFVFSSAMFTRQNGRWRFSN